MFGNVYLSHEVCLSQDFNGNINIGFCCLNQESEKFLLMVLSMVPHHYNAELQRQRQKILNSILDCATVHILTEKLKPNQNSRSSNNNNLTDCVFRDLITCQRVNQEESLYSALFSPKAQCKLHVNCSNGHSRHISAERNCRNYCFFFFFGFFPFSWQNQEVVQLGRNGLCFSSGTWTRCKGVDYIAMPSGDTTEKQISNMPRDVKVRCGSFVMTAASSFPYSAG